MFESSLNTEIYDLLKSKGYLSDNNNANISSVKYFSNIDNELFSLYNGVGVRINHNSVIIELIGKDCKDFLHRITTNSILYLDKNKLVKTIFTNEKGRIIGLAEVINFEDHLWLKTDIYFKDKIIAWINRYVITDDVRVNDISDNYSLVDFYGPQRFSFIEWLFNSQNISLKPDTIQKIIIDDFNLYITQSSFEISNFSSLNLIVDKGHLGKLLNFIFDNKGPFDFNLIGNSAFESYRIEQGILMSEFELNDNFNPHELNLSELIDTKKGCYIGQEVLARLETYDKVQKKITGLEFSEDFTLSGIDEVFDKENEVAGYITSKTYSQKLKKHIGLGVIRKKYLSGNYELFYLTEQKNKIQITLHNLPFIKTIR